MKRLVAGFVLAAGLVAQACAAIVAALNDPDNRKRMEEVGFEIVANTPAERSAFQAPELARWRPVTEVGKVTRE